MVDEWVGDKLPPERAAGSTRFYFVNANRIRYGALGGEMDEVCSREYLRVTLMSLVLQRQS
jgi:hypothetical protein